MVGGGWGVGGGEGGKDHKYPMCLIRNPFSGAQDVTKLIKPVLNWANVCSPNILRTVRRTYDSFLN